MADELAPDLPEDTEAEQQRQAAEARAMAPLGRRRAQVVPKTEETKPVAEGQNPYDQFDKDPKDDGIEVMERLRLNRQDAYYRNTIAGSSRLALMADTFKSEDPPDATPEIKEINKQMREEYQHIIADLAAYDEMPSFGTTLEAITALGGQLEGSLVSPESWIGWGASGGTWLARAGWAGLQQMGVQAAINPAVQAANIAGGTREEFSLADWAMATAAGFGFGFGGQAGGEAVGAGVRALGRGFDRLSDAGLGHIIGPKAARQEMALLAREDPAFMGVREAQWYLNPENAQYIHVETAPPKAPPRPQYQAGPEHGFTDAVAVEKERLANSYGAAQPKLGRLNEEAKFNAFQKEAGPTLDAAVEQYGLDRETVRLGNIWEHYDRAPGQSVEDAVESAIGKWVSAEERAAIQGLPDSELERDLAEWAKAYDAEAERMAYTSGTSRPDFRGNQVALPGLSSVLRDYRPAHLPEEIPFEHPVAHATESGHPAAGGEPQPGQAEGAAVGGTGPPVRSEGGGERPAGQEPERAAGAGAGAVGAEIPRERVLATERTAQGEQTLIPGVEPVTDAERLKVLEQRKLRGGNAPADEGLFDVASRGQADVAGLKATGERPDIEALAQRKSGGGLAGEQERPEAGLPGTPSPEREIAIRSLQQQSMDFAKALDFPLRQGRVQMRGALGTFNRATGVVRVKEVPDFEVVAHEGGHALESKMGPELTELTEAHGWELAKLDYDQGPGGQRVNEGFAEYIRLYMGNPKAAENLAPTFTPEFRAFMEQRRPDLMRLLNDTATAYQAYLDAPSIDAVGAVRRSKSEEPSRFQETVDGLKPKELPNTIKSVMQTAYDTMLDDKAPMARAMRELAGIIAEKEGRLVDLKAVDNPEVLLRLLGRSRQAATRDLMDGVHRHGEIYSQGPGLADGITEAIGQPSVWGKWDEGRRLDFSTYTIAMRADVLWDKFKAGDLANPPVSFSQADARQAMADFERVYPNFRSAARSVHAYTMQLLRKSFEGGLITRDLYQKLLGEEFYVPFMRDMSDKPKAGGGGGGGTEGPGMTEVVKRMRGSSRDILDPLESIMMQTYLVNRTIRHNDVIKAFADFAERAGPEGGKYFEPIPAREARKVTFDLGAAIERKAKEIGMDATEAELFASNMGELSEESPLLGSFWKMDRTSPRGEPIVFYKDGGELKAGRVMSKDEGHNLYELLTSAPEPVTDLWVQLIGAGAGLKRAGIITNPTFILTNYIRDQVAASILRSDYVPIIGGLRGLADEFRQGQNAVLYGYAGGVAGGASTGPVERAIEQDINALAKKGYLVNRLTSFKGFLELASMTEAGTRNSIFGTVFETKKRQGLSDYEAMVEAAFAAQDLLDFSRHGSRTLAIRNMLPFLNAHIQGLDKARRTLIEPIVRHIKGGEVFAQDSAEYRNALNGWMKAGALGGALGAVWAAINADSEAYRDASPYLKGTHLVIPWGNKLFIMPKPFELGIGFTAGEYGYQALAQKDPRMAMQFANAAWQTLQPPNPLTDIPVVSTAAELMSNTSFFTWKPIVPDQLQKLPAEQQYSDRTSEMAKQIGKLTGVSPMKVEYGIGSMFGTWGRDVMAMSQGVNEDAPAAALDDALFLRRFVKDPTRSSDVTTRFWDYMSRTTGKFNQNVALYDKLVKNYHEGDATKFLAELPANEKAFVTLKSAANERGKPAFTADDRRLHPLQRAYDAVTVLNNLRGELASNIFTPYATKELEKMSPVMRRDLLENIRELTQMEMRNAFVIMGEGGYANRPMLDVNDVMAKIRHLSPAVADEISTRYATQKIYKTDAVRQAWPALREELVRHGSDADVKGIGSDARVEGYEFDGTKVKKPGPRRLPMRQGAVQTPDMVKSTVAENMDNRVNFYRHPDSGAIARADVGSRQVVFDRDESGRITGARYAA